MAFIGSMNCLTLSQSNSIKRLDDELEASLFAENEKKVGVISKYLNEFINFKILN